MPCFLTASENGSDAVDTAEGGVVFEDPLRKIGCR